LRAREKSLDDGAVMPSYRGDPQRTIDLLQNVVATELVCVLRYRMHAITADGINRRMLEQMLEDEEHHAADMHDLLVAQERKPFLK
jgi:bacterioferritin